MKIRKYDTLSEEFLSTLVELESIVFENPIQRNTLVDELSGKQDLVGLIAEVEGRPCGYKVGFQHSPEVFYSWIGGVLPDYRRRGIAKSLLLEQHKIARELGYACVRTSTKNKYRGMLLLNIQSGFDVIGVQKKRREAHQSILLEIEL